MRNVLNLQKVSQVLRDTPVTDDSNWSIECTGHSLLSTGGCIQDS